jgi:phage gp37-like protein
MDTLNLVLMNLAILAASVIVPKPHDPTIASNNRTFLYVPIGTTLAAVCLFLGRLWSDTASATSLVALWSLVAWSVILWVRAVTEEEVEERIRTLHSRYISTKDVLESSESKYKSLQNSYDKNDRQLQARISELKTKCDTLGDQLDTKEKMYQAATQVAETLQKHNATLKSDLANSQNKVAELVEASSRRRATSRGKATEAVGASPKRTTKRKTP